MLSEMLSDLLARSTTNRDRNRVVLYENTIDIPRYLPFYKLAININKVTNNISKFINCAL